MRRITRKSIIQEELQICLAGYDHNGISSLMTLLHDRILDHRVKFPLLEYCAHEIAQHVDDHDIIDICQVVSDRGSEGGNVIIGILLQGRLDKHLLRSLSHAARFIDDGQEWYVSDIIGERVFGWSLLHYFAESFTLLEQLKQHDSRWVVRSIGAGSHYAIKKGLAENHTDKVFGLLLSVATHKDRQVRAGIGWAAKTTAKFHPKVIAKYQAILDDKDRVGSWFVKKVQMGLERHHYAQRN